MKLLRLLPLMLVWPLVGLGQPASTPRAVMISIDGLMPATYTTAGSLKVPNLRKLAAEGAWATGVQGVVPTVTYPSHTTLITGVPPAVHGVFDNRILDPEGRSDGAWYWYADAIRVPTLPGAVRARGLSAGAVSWPVTVGMDLDYNVPEFWRTSHPEALSLISALSRPRHVLDHVANDRKAKLVWPFTDRERTDIATYLMTTFQPHLLLLHLVEADTAQHGDGPGSPRATEAVERMDGYVGDVLSALDRSGHRAGTCVAIVSDHGFRPLAEQLQPNALFKKEGLIVADESGTIVKWDAYFHSSGGSGFVYLSRPTDQALRTRVGALLATLRQDPANGIEALWTRVDLDRLGAHPGAAFGISMARGFYSSGGHDVLRKPTNSRGGHGFDPSVPELHASLVLSATCGAPRGDLGVVRMTQVAPTLARRFGVGLSPDADTPLWP